MSITLLTGLGTRLIPTRYSMGDGDPISAVHASLALIQFLPVEQRPQRAVVLVTCRARRTTWGEYRQALQSLGVDAVAVDVPDGVDEEQVHRTFKAAADAISSGERIILDITAGLRTTPFLLYAVALFLQVLRDVKVEGAWYGMYESLDPVKPLVSLGPLLQLSDWLWAARQFVEHGSTRALSQVVQNERGLKRAWRGELAGMLSPIGRAHDYALPLEHGAKVCELGGYNTRAWRQLIRDNPYAADVLRVVQTEASQWQVRIPVDGEGWKRALRFDSVERARQRAWMRSFLDRGQEARYLSVAREWLVSCVITDDERWLERDTRVRAETALNSLALWSAAPDLSGLLTDEQRELAATWSDLRDLRNALQHQGFRSADLFAQILRGRPARRVEARLARYDGQPLPSIQLGPDRGLLLVAPLGRSPGSLWSAIQAINPENLIVIMSSESSPGLEEVLIRSDFDRSRVHEWVVAEPFTGFDEVGACLRRLSNPRKRLDDANERARLLLLAGASEVVISLTGGTTLLGHAAQGLGDVAKSMGVASRRIALVDRRPVVEQRESPFVQGEVVWIDGRNG